MKTVSSLSVNSPQLSQKVIYFFSLLRVWAKMCRTLVTSQRAQTPLPGQWQHPQPGSLISDPASCCLDFVPIQTCWKLQLRISVCRKLKVKPFVQGAVNRGLNEPQIYTVLGLTNHWRLHHCSVERTVRIWKRAQCGASTDLLKQQRRKLFKMDLHISPHSTSLPFVLLIVRDRMKNEVVTIGGIWGPWRCLVGYEILDTSCLIKMFGSKYLWHK